VNGYHVMRAISGIASTLDMMGYDRSKYCWRKT
jgi:hypothetical protein